MFVRKIEEYYICDFCKEIMENPLSFIKSFIEGHDDNHFFEFSINPIIKREFPLPQAPHACMKCVANSMKLWLYGNGFINEI